VAIAEQQLATLIMAINESMSALDSTTVGTYYIEFIAELAAIIDNPVAATTYPVSRSETAAITETNSGRYLWEIIDDTQSVTWQNISNPQTPGWSDVDTEETPGWTLISTQ
jgi:hypothetical protein